MESEKEIELAVRKMVAQEIGGHRQFLQTQFKHMTWGIGIIFASAAIAFTFILGKSITESKDKLVQEVDSKVVEYRINESLKRRVSEFVSIAVENAVNSPEIRQQINSLVGTQTDDFVKSVSGDIQDQLAELVKSEVKAAKGLDADALIRNAVLPIGTIVAFNARQCPTGWEVFVPAEGRFLRGIDPAGDNRSPGSIQADAFQGHIHNISSITSKDHGSKDQTPHGYASGAYGLLVNQTTGVSSDGSFGPARIANETRPKNVAVLFCEKK
jgi:hypothetical protein